MRKYFKGNTNINFTFGKYGKLIKYSKSVFTLLAINAIFVKRREVGWDRLG